MHNSHLRAGWFRANSRRAVRSPVKRSEREDFRRSLVLAGVSRWHRLPGVNL